MAIGTIIKTIQDIMRKDAGVDGDAQRIGQLAWMLFLKILDDREIEKEEAKKGYKSPLPEELRWRSWAADPEGLTGDELSGFVNDALFPGLKGLKGTDPLSGVVRSVFGDAHNDMKSGHLLRQVVNKLNDVNFNRSADRHEIGGVYEQLLGDLRSAGNAGEYYTPRAVTEFMVERIDPQLGELILDPACGTGGFLVCAIEHLRKQQAKSEDVEQKIRASIKGIEKTPLPHLLCMTNMVLHEIDAPTQIRRENALVDHGKIEQVDVIVTNPPFGGIEEEGIEGGFPGAFQTRGTADLLLYLIMEKLRPGGRAAVVVPDGMLFGEGVKTRIKQKLLDECNLHTIIRLPRGVFSPYTAIKTNLLFFTKGEATKEIWYYEHPYPQGYKNYSKTKPLRIEEFEPEREWWKNRRVTPHAWKISIEEIRARHYNLDVHNPGPTVGQGPSRLVWLKLSRFRGFSRLVLELPQKGPAVLIGVNGAGKSTVLDAIAMQLSSFAALASGFWPRQAEAQLGQADIKTGAESAEVSAMFRVGSNEQVWDMRATRGRAGGSSPKKEVAEQASRLLEGLERSEGVRLPVLCFYPSTRGLGDGSPVKRPSYLFRQLEAYDRAFGPSLGPFQDFVHWFREAEDAENEGRLRIDPNYRNQRLEVVRRAVQRFLGELGTGHFSNLRMERPGVDDAQKSSPKPAELVLDKDGVRLGIQQLSEGEKSTILLVADLARRLAIANPELDEPLGGEGIILIDEIDIHLHPGWQRGFLPALGVSFPGCQFIVTTHSPQVLSVIPRENVFILENFELLKVTPHTYGRDPNSILGEVFGVPERPREIEEKIHKAALLIDAERVDEARTVLDELLSILGEHDTELLRLRTVLSFVETPVED